MTRTPWLVGFTLTLAASPALGQTARWIAAEGGSFSTPTHWESGAVPDSATRALFELPTQYMVSLDSDRALGGLTMSTGVLTLDLHGRTLSLPADLIVSSGSLRVQGGHLNHITSLPTIRSSIFVNGGVFTLEEDSHISLANSMVINPGAAVVLRGTVSKCTPTFICNSYTLHSRVGSSLLVQGGITSGGAVILQGSTEVVRGYLGGLYCTVQGDLLIDGGQLVASEQWIDLYGTTILRSGGRIAGGSTGITGHKLVNIRGGTLTVEGAGSTVGATFAIEDQATVTVRSGALVGDLAGSGESRCASGALILQEGGACGGRFSLGNSGRLRIEPGASGPREFFFLGTPDSVVEIGLDPLRTPIFQAMEAPSFHRDVSGHMRIELHNTNAFQVGSEVTLFTTTGAFAGGFTSVTIPPLDGGRIAQVVISPHAIKLRINQGPPSCYSADFDGDGSPATQADIAAFFACLAGNCCATCASPDFNGDTDYGTDADIEAFFRVITGQSC